MSGYKKVFNRNDIDTMQSFASSHVAPLHFLAESSCSYPAVMQQQSEVVTVTLWWN